MKYASCRWIESAVVLEPDRLRFCCVPHSGNKGYVPICDFEGGPLPVDRILEERRRLTEANNTPGADSPCKGCHFLEERDWDAERSSDAPFSSIYVSHYSICNLRCRYCYVYLYEGDLVDVGYALRPVIESLLEEGELEDGGYVEWGGGEPTILDDFTEVQELLRERGFRQQVSTSGVKFSPEIERALGEGKMQAVISVDAGTPETYRNVKGRDAFEQVWASIQRYAQTGGDFRLKYILRHNNSGDDDLDGFARMAVRAGVREVVLTPDQEEVAAGTLQERTLFAFSRLRHLLKRRGLVVYLRDEYASPEVMAQLTKYIPYPLKGWRYGLRRLAARPRETLGRHLRRASTEADAALHGWIRRRAEELLGEPDALGERQADVLDLLAQHVRHPAPENQAQLARLARALPGKRKLREGVTAVGFSADGWSEEGRPAFIVADGATHRHASIVTYCLAEGDDLPVAMEITDGFSGGIAYTFQAPGRRRIELPAIEPGDVRIFEVRKDRFWSSPGDPRRLGVRITDLADA